MRFFDRLRRPPIQPTDFPCFEDRPKTRQNVQVEQLRGALQTVQPLASSNRQLSVGMDSSLLFLINAFRIDHYSTTSIFREKIFCSLRIRHRSLSCLSLIRFRQASIGRISPISPCILWRAIRYQATTRSWEHTPLQRSPR